jgi:CHAT domain-containing protein/predicted negative regulator of RcsB-dependent stress response
VNARQAWLLVGVAIILGGWSGCRSSPPPEEVYGEAEGLRLKYEKAAAEQAIARYEAAASAWASRRDLRQAARASQRAGMTHTQLGRLQPALRAYQAALVTAKASGDAGLESELLSDVGIAQSLVALREADFEEAQRHCDAALAMARLAGGGRAEARARMCLGEAAYNRGQRVQALDFYTQALATSERIGDARGTAEALLARASVFSDQNDFERARPDLATARQSWTAAGDIRGAAITLVAASKLRERHGEYQDALRGLHEALETLRRMGDQVWEGATLSAIGSVYMRAGEPTNALDYWERALERFSAAGLSPFSVDLLRSLGEAYLASGDDRRALERFERALTLGEQLGDAHWQAYSLWNIGSVYLYRGDYARAVTYLERSLAIQERIRDPRTQANTRTSLGEAWRLQGESARARASFAAAVDISRSADDRLGEAAGLDGLARVLAGTGDLDAARQSVERALTLAESLRAELGGRDLRRSYSASVYRYHETHLDVLMQLHRARPGRGFAAAAFSAAERARARSLLEGLSAAGVDLRSDVSPELLAREETLKKEFDAWAARQRQSLDEPARQSPASRLADEYRDLERRYGTLAAEIERASPRYAAIARPQPLTLRQVQEEVLDAETVLLLYALGESRGYLWAVSKTAWSVHDLPARASLSQESRQLHERLTARLALSGTLDERRRQADESDFLFWEQARHLSDVLLGPVAGFIRGKRIVIVADGALQYVPFAALPEPAGASEPVPLVVNHEIISLPSASVMAVLRRETSGRALPPKSVAVLADPVFEADDPRLRAALRAAGRPAAAPRPAAPRLRLARLAATREESAAILSAAPGGTSISRLGFDANRSVALSGELARYRTVHFATHGVFDNEDPGMSGIMLSMFDGQGRPQDGFVRLHDIYRLRLPAELVVLSACSSALGRQVSGEGLVGIVRGFMYGGAKRVVASLWKVDDEATGELMRRFYAGMLQRGLTPAAALRAAQLEVRQQSRWVSPFYWAAFSLQGEWRP